MNQRTRNTKIATETLEILKKKSYKVGETEVDISQAIHNSVNNSVYYPGSLDISEISFQESEPIIEVTSETTTQAAVRLSSAHQDLVALNFASATNPGGGFLSGAQAQEEDLCRRSALYACIKNKPMYYNDNIRKDSSLYTDGIIYSPRVPFIRNEYLVLDDPYLLSIITAPAPCLRYDISFDRKVLMETIDNRTIRILRVAAFYSHKNIILGAWGCGAFMNDPEMVAQSFKKALKVVPAFEHVCFAIYDNEPGQYILNTFKNIMNDVI